MTNLFIKASYFIIGIGVLAVLMHSFAIDIINMPVMYISTKSMACISGQVGYERLSCEYLTSRYDHYEIVYVE